MSFEEFLRIVALLLDEEAAANPEFSQVEGSGILDEGGYDEDYQEFDAGDNQPL